MSALGGASFPYLDFFQMVHSMASYYQASEGRKAFQCMFESAYAMIPDEDPHKSILYEALTRYPLEGIALDNSISLLQWSYQVNSYVHRQLYGVGYIPYDQFKKKYDHANMNMSTWSHPTWKMIHYYASKHDGSGRYALSYKAYVSCLQFLLPCPKCKQHLKDNLANHPIDQYFSSAVDLFTWSYILHQTVSSQTGKKGINIQDARRLYGL
jgi:hypothetical protein